MTFSSRTCCFGVTTVTDWVVYNQSVRVRCRLNRKAKYNLEKDLADKFQALAIDGHNAELRLNSQGNRLIKDAGRMTDKYCCIITLL